MEALVDQGFVTPQQSKLRIWDHVAAVGCTPRATELLRVGISFDKGIGILVDCTLREICGECNLASGGFLLINLGLTVATAATAVVTGRKEPEPPAVYAWSFPKGKPASAFALSSSKKGLDVAMGWGGAACAYLPPGRIRSEVAHARDVAAGGSEQYLASADQMHFFDCLPLSRSLSRVEVDVIRGRWDMDVKLWWPDDKDGASQNSRPDKLPFPLLLGMSCKVDYIRLALVGKHEFGTVVGELTNSHLAPLDGAPQAIIAAMSAAADMRAHGLPAHDCVVPFFMSNGQLQQHGAVYLLEPCMPCAVMTSPVLDVSDAEGRRRVSTARWATRCIAERTHALLKALFASSAAATAEAKAAGGATWVSATVDKPVAALDCRKYIIKQPLPLVGPTDSHAVLHQLSVFECLLRTAAARVIVPPAAALMQRLVVDEEKSEWVWRAEHAIAFPRLEGFTTGVPKVGQPHRHAVLASLKAALYALHGAGVVHMDLYPGNIMWRPCERQLEAEGGAAGGGASSAAAGGAGSGPSSTGCPPAGALEVEVEVEVRLVDFDAALFLDQAVPAVAREVIERNGHMHTYHPCFFDDFEGAPRVQKAVVDFDWWHFALLQWPDAASEAACPFVDVCSTESDVAAAATAKLFAWRQDESAVAAVLETVKRLVAEEQADLSAGSGGSALQALTQRLSRLSV